VLAIEDNLASNDDSLLTTLATGSSKTTRYNLDLLTGSVHNDTSSHNIEAIWDEALLDMLEDTLL